MTRALSSLTPGHTMVTDLFGQTYRRGQFDTEAAWRRLVASLEASKATLGDTCAICKSAPPAIWRWCASCHEQVVLARDYDADPDDLREQRAELRAERSDR